MNSNSFNRRIIHGHRLNHSLKQLVKHSGKIGRRTTRLYTTGICRQNPLRIILLLQSSKTTLVNTSQPLRSGRIRLDYIDALRGLAAVMVMVCHCTQVDASIVLPAPVSKMMEAFKYGVQLFFVISAFTIFYSLYRSDTSTHNFFVRRFFRIAPLYFVAVAAYGFLYDSDAAGIGSNLVFLHGLSPKYINSVVPGGWSIGVEMLFYCLVPLLFRRVTNLRLALCFFLGAVLLSFFLFYGYRKFVTPTAHLESYMYFWLPNQLPAFGIGMIIYFLTFHNHPTFFKGLFFPLVLTSFLVILGIMTRYRFFGEHILFALACGLFIFLLKFRSFPGLVNKATLFLGKISYSLYLSQYAAINILQKTGLFSFFKEKTGATPYLNTAINFSLLLVVTIIISYVTFRLIEQPFQNFGKRFLKKKIPLMPIPVNEKGSVRYAFPTQPTTEGKN
ncbi:MAG: acyltransferase [Chitinophagaceae bacterium]|nr:MAG: acyltransferase [Chitinophagaceae bacterium]